MIQRDAGPLSRNGLAGVARRLQRGAVMSARMMDTGSPSASCGFLPSLSTTVHEAMHARRVEGRPDGLSRGRCRRRRLPTSSATDWYARGPLLTSLTQGWAWGGPAPPTILARAQRAGGGVRAAFLIACCFGGLRAGLLAVCSCLRAARFTRWLPMLDWWPTLVVLSVFYLIHWSVQSVACPRSTVFRRQHLSARRHARSGALRSSGCRWCLLVF